VPPFVRTLLMRHEPVRDVAEHAKSALGAVLGILAIGALAYVTALPLLLAPLGATAVILFGYPGGALAQPVNVFGGYLLATVVGVVTALVFPGQWWMAAPAVGLTLFGMQTLRITHPPAGAVPVLALQMPGDSATLFVTLLVACLGMLLLAVIVHRLPPRRTYPAPHPGLPVQTPVTDGSDKPKS